MDNLNKGGSPSFKDAGGNRSDNENELNQEMSFKLKSPRKKQLPNKSFMNPTISAANKASVPKKKILGERNETVEQTSLQRCYSFGSKKPVKSPVVDSITDDDVEEDLVGGRSCLQPYDPVKNYLSPRPKFLRYNPDRRRKILKLQESELQDSCSGKESVEEEAHDDESCEESGSEGDEEDMAEFGEDRCCSVKGFFKFVFVVIALVLTTQAICSMNSPSASQTVDSVWGFNRSLNHVYGFNLSEVGYGLIREPDILMERMKEGSVKVQFAKTDDCVHQGEAKKDESDVIQDELKEDEIKASEVVETYYVEADFDQNGATEEDDSDANEKSYQFAHDGILQEEIKASEVVDTDYVKAETVDDFSQDGVTEENDSDANEKNHQLENDAELEDAKPNDVLIKSTSFDPTILILIGNMLVLTSFAAIYRSRCKKVEKEEFKNPQSVMEEEKLVRNETSLLVPPQQNDVTKEISHVIPSVELLGEFVFGEETTSNMSPEIILTAAVSSSLTESSHTIKKQRRKNAEVVTPSSMSVRRSSRLKRRSSVMSP